MSRSVAPRRARPEFSRQAYVPPRYQTRLWGRVIFLFFILALAAVIGITVGGYWMLNRAQSSSSAAVTVHVGPGDSVGSIAERLQSKGLINNALLFKLDARLQGLGSNLKVGDYTIHRNMSIHDMVASFGHYTDKMMTITIPEGLRSEQIAAIVAKHGMSAQDFLREVRHPTISYSILADKPMQAGLEGYLFPNTYTVSIHETGAGFADFMVQQLNKVFTPAMRQAARARDLSVYKVLTLASIVEREAKVPVERPIIASVYENRLRIHMVLDADPTVQYALGTPKNWWPVLTVADYKLNLPYSTYTHNGLPPGPIANPGLASIQAAIHPKKTPYLFFVAKGNGHHVFATTYAQQLANEQRYLSQP